MSSIPLLLLASFLHVLHHSAIRSKSMRKEGTPDLIRVAELALSLVNTPLRRHAANIDETPLSPMLQS